jgi:diguanylate cyclase (GGDEF)-like protein
VRFGTSTRFSLLLILLLLGIVGVQFSGLAAQQEADRSWQHRVRLAQDVELIRYYDESLTGSARLAASTGNVAYVARYRAAIPKLDAAIADALRVVPDVQARAALRSTDTANQRLIDLEERSFARLGAGDRRGAYALVTSAEYARWKEVYRDGMTVALNRLDVAARSESASSRHRQRLALAAGGGAAGLLALLWLHTARGLRRSQHARSRIEEELRVEANADPVTGLANRRLFRAQLAHELARPDSAGSAVFFVDLDRFKEVNDTLGHAHGDRLLAEVADRLRELLHGHPRALAARLGGDEFAVLVPGAGRIHAVDGSPPLSVERMADELVASLSRPYATASRVPVTASLGVAVSESGAADPGELLRGADLAMYVAKSEGGGGWRRYADHMHAELLARVELESQLRDGLIHDELVVHYQPIYDLNSGKRRGVEALVRWQHPQRGLLGPAEFIPIAEQSDLINGIGQVVLEKVCHQLTLWRQEQGEDAPGEVAINVSTRQLHQPGYAAHVAALLELNGLEPGCLMLEITESTVMADPATVADVLTDLRDLGLRIAIDDFGTGHSSLARLHELPVDEVKIDQSFVRAASGPGGDTTMLELVITLAGRLGLDLVAEGIETPAQLEMLQRLGARYGQGFLLARPAPSDGQPSSRTLWTDSTSP